MQNKSLIALVLVSLLSGRALGEGASKWVSLGPDQRLHYTADDQGNRIMDFSHAGYKGGGVALPDVPVKATVEPTGGADDTAVIQAAIDQVSALQLADGIRGAVLLAPGEFPCAGSLVLGASGVVLRGSGRDADGTTIKMVGPRHAAITIGGGRSRRNGRRSNGAEAAAGQATPDRREFIPAQTNITDAYVPAGTNVFTVASTNGFAVGDVVELTRPTTAAWVHFMQMDDLKRDGRPQTWIGLGRNGVAQRKITAIDGNKITVDVSLADSYDAAYLNPPGTEVSKVQPSSRTTNVGVEHLHIQCPPLEVAYGDAPYSAIRIAGDDCWVKDVYCEETMNSTVLSGDRITMEHVEVFHTYPNLGASKPTDFSLEGSQELLDRCKITGDNMYFVWTGSLRPGPHVLLNCTFRGRGSRIQPHQRWSTGMLVDNCHVPDGGIDFMNRGTMGSGHGWTMGWAVAWNCTAKTYIIQNPPSVANWAIGCIGERVQTARPFDAAPLLAEGNFDSHGVAVAPRSLYLAQLVDRRGPDAMHNMGYGANDAAGLADSTLQRLPVWRGEVDAQLGEDLAIHRPINASARDKDRQFGGEKAVDGNDKTYWATNDNPRSAALEVDMEGPVEINALALGEADGLENQVQQYEVEGQVDSEWRLLSSGTSIGARKVDRFPAVTVWKVRLNVVRSQPYPAIRAFQLYRTEFATEAAK
jgi:hypothetical protein